MKISAMKNAALSLIGCAVLIGQGSPADAAEVGINNVTVTSVLAAGDGSFFITLSSNHPSCLNASNPKRHYVYPGQNGVTEDGAKRLYAAALFAAAYDKPVAVGFDDTDNSCALLRLLVS